MLSTELNSQIEKSKLSAGDKLVTRVTVAALETVKAIAAKLNKPIEDIEAADVVEAMTAAEAEAN